MKQCLIQESAFSVFFLGGSVFPAQRKKKKKKKKKNENIIGVAERGCYFLILSPIFCYSGHLDFLARLKEVLFCTTFCYFLLFSAILGSSATPT